jgi:ABC-type protease/lipase transport system fused ATPase/permease subunit
MNKSNQRNYVTLAVAALSAILVASIFAIGAQNAIAQNMTGGNMTGGNMTHGR